MRLIVSVRDEAVLARLRGYPERLVNRLVVVMNRLTLEIQTSVKEQKLTGQVLHTDTGTLRRSINREVKVTGSEILGIVGTNLEYAGVHEFGYSGSQTVRSHLRTISQAFGKQLANPVRATIGAHTRSMTIPERSYLRSTLTDYEARVRADIQRGAREAVS